MAAERRFPHRPAAPVFHLCGAPAGVRMPDWRKAEDYAFLESIDRHEWAWEFLRRNPAYRKAYSAALALAKVRPRDPEKEPEIKALMDAATEPFGLLAPADPDLRMAAARPTFRDQVGVRVLEKWKPSIPAGGLDDSWPWPGYPTHIGLLFRLDDPIDVQIAIAADILKRCHHRLDEDYGALPHRRAPPFREGRFPLYVRVLDAALAGASDGEITRVLFGDRDDPRRSMTKARETARHMAAEGYLDLLLLPPGAVGLLDGPKSPEE